MHKNTHRPWVHRHDVPMLPCIDYRLIPIQLGLFHNSFRQTKQTVEEIYDADLRGCLKSRIQPCVRPPRPPNSGGRKPKILTISPQNWGVRGRV
jgi:hypothetical protein